MPVIRCEDGEDEPEQDIRSGITRSPTAEDRGTDDEQPDHDQQTRQDHPPAQAQRTSHLLDHEYDPKECIGEAQYSEPDPAMMLIHGGFRPLRRRLGQ